MHAVDALAERVLFGDRLADKLDPWPAVAPGGRGRPTLPGAPGRPPGLSLPTDRRGVSVRDADLSRDDGRAAVLHELANHELQAIELLALALLRWPDAPAALRRGWIATLADEQRHAGLYLARLEACGGAFGQVPPSRFFWDALAPVDDLGRFVAGLSLCFELANLDFCLYWRDRFAAAGDEATAGVLQTVHDDEIRHVALGRVWFARQAGGPWIDAWARALPPPLTPARSRGPRFDADGRLRAGFSDAEVARLRVEGGSRGRPSRVLWFDAAVEERVAGRSPSRVSRAVTADLATLPMFLCGAEDVVVAPMPDPTFLAGLAELGFEIPRFVPEVSAAALGPHPIAGLEPWGPTPERPALGPTRWDPRWRALSSKAESLRRAQSLPAHPAHVSPLGAVWDAPGDPGDGPWLLKAPFSAAGGDRLAGQGALTPAQARWVERRLARGPLLWQPRWERVADLSVHVDVGERVRIDGITRFATTPAGVFVGTWLGRPALGVDAELARALHGDGDPARGMLAALESAGRAAGAWAAELGWRGPLSIDAMVVRTPDGLRLHPWLETNARRTLGRVGLALTARIGPRASGWWRVERASDASRAALARACVERPARVEAGRLVGGVLPTTDPARATSLLTWIDLDASDPRRA